MADLSTYRAPDLIAAPFTPFKDGEVNFDMIQLYADYLVKTHFQGIFVNGSLGEGISLTISERKKLAEAWMNVSKGRLAVIVHVGANCVKDSQELAQHAENIGASAIAALSPNYYKPENEAVLVNIMATIAASAPKLPFYYYDINFVTGVYIDVIKFMEMAKDRIPNLKGLKHSSKELPNAHGCKLIDNGRFQVLNGTDNQYLSCLALGLPGVVAASYLGNIFHDMKTAFDKGDIETARKHQTTAQVLTNIRSKHGGGMNTTKAMFRILTGVDVGSVRLPLRELTENEIESLRKDFQVAGLSDICKPKEE